MSRGGRRTSDRLVVDLDYVTRKLRKCLQIEAKDCDVAGEMLAKRVPIHFGGISDPFSNKAVAAISRDLLELLSMYDYPVIISTKNSRELLQDETMRILRRMKYLVVQVSVTTSNDKLANQIEPNVPTATERIECIQTLSKEGIYSIVRLQPLLVPWFNEVVNELIPLLGSSGCRHLVVEHLKLPVERKLSLFGDMFKAIGWNGYEFYKSHGAKLIGREWILPNKFKWENLQPIINAIHKHGMTYGSGDYGLNHLGDTNCCCGIDRVKGFSNWFEGNLASLMRHSGSDGITFDQIQKYWFPKRSVKMVMNSNCRLEQGNSMLAYLREKWNSPGAVNAPDAFLGISWDGDYDEDGNCLYFKEKAYEKD